MRDPYFYDDVPVLKNKLNIKDKEELESTEADITFIKLLDVDRVMKNGKFEFNHLKAIHKHIFEDIYGWAGEIRTINIEKEEKVLAGKSVDYCDYNLIEKEASLAIKELKEIQWEKLGIEEKAQLFSKKLAKLWRVHPFREGNTRTVIAFAAQFAESRNFPLDKSLFKKHSDYLRTSLVMASIGEYSEYEHLTRIIKDAMQEGKKRSAKHVVNSRRNRQKTADVEFDR